MATLEVGNTPSSSQASPVENRQRKVVPVPESYGLTIGFEVNFPQYFKEDIQQLGSPASQPPNDGDYGHAFFYLTKDERILRFLALVLMAIPLRRTPFCPSTQLVDLVPLITL